MTRDDVLIDVEVVKDGKPMTVASIRCAVDSARQLQTWLDGAMIPHKQTGEPSGLTVSLSARREVTTVEPFDLREA